MTTIEQHAQYTITSTDDEALRFDWKPSPHLGAADFAQGITQFASACKTRKPARAVIDARQLDQTSEAVNWLRGQQSVDGLDAYQAWWEREIVPLYNEATITALAVITGDPSAPGQIPTPDQANFAMGYFPNPETAQTWAPA